MRYLFYDTETWLITEFDKAPLLVCAQIIFNEGEPELLPRYRAEIFLRCALALDDVVWVLARACFDFAVTIRTWPDLAPLVFELYEQGRVIDVQIYEKFSMLAQHGYIDSRPTLSGGKERLSYSLAAIANRRLGLEMGGKTKDDPTSWRLRLNELDGKEAEEYPPEAVTYALDDVRVLPLVLEKQLADGTDYRAAPITAAAAFGLYLMTCQGVDIDPVERTKVEAWVASELTDERLEPLYQSGILRRPVPSQPYANQLKRAQEIGPVGRDAMIAAGIKFTEAKPASVDTKVLRSVITDVCNAHEIPIRQTETGLVSAADEFLQEIEHHDPRLAAFAHRQRLGKIVSTELPRIQAARVHPNYDELKETGRTSSYDPNIQNVDPRVRGCYVPPAGWVILSVDYSAIELVTLAQKQLALFGKSTLAQLINNGKDPHAYLGARLAYELDRENYCRVVEFRGVLSGSNFGETLYDYFIALKKGTEEQQAYFSHWRTLAKPTGLGYPGGLGPDTFMTFAKATYGVVVDRARAMEMRDIWFDTFPEMRDYFDWVNTQCATGEDDYAYSSPAGMLRNHCSYCACANGAALQTPAAEGGKLAIWEVVRRCFDPSKESILYGCKPWAWIHDQILLSIPEDGWEHERAGEVSDCMVSCMKQVIPDVAVRTEACVMRRWSKYAKPVFDTEGRLTIWEPAV